MPTNSAIPVITFDGPSGVGKGTVGRLLAKHLGWHFLDSGALYRVLGYAARQAKVTMADETGLAELARDLDVRFVDSDEQAIRVLYKNQDVSRAIRDDESSKAASEVAAFAAVRQALLKRQRAFRQAPGLIADGRDMGTVVFPDAVLKLFLDATVEERAKRRQKQLQQGGKHVSLGAVFEDIKARDHRDRHRKVSPMVPARDAIIIDTTQIDADAVFKLVMDRVEGLHLKD